MSVEQERHKTREELAEARKELQVQSSEAEQAETVLRQQKDEMEEWAANRYVDADSCTRPCVCLILNPFFSRVAVPLLVTVERSSF